MKFVTNRIMSECKVSHNYNFRTCFLVNFEFSDKS